MGLTSFEPANWGERKKEEAGQRGRGIRGMDKELYTLQNIKYNRGRNLFVSGFGSVLICRFNSYEYRYRACGNRNLLASLFSSSPHFPENRLFSRAWKMFWILFFRRQEIDFSILFVKFDNSTCIRYVFTRTPAARRLSHFKRWRERKKVRNSSLNRKAIFLANSIRWFEIARTQFRRRMNRSDNESKAANV